MSLRRATGTRAPATAALATTVLVVSTLVACAAPLPLGDRAAGRAPAGSGGEPAPVPYVVVLEEGAVPAVSSPDGGAAAGAAQVGAEDAEDAEEAVEAVGAVADQHARLGLGRERERVFAHALQGYAADLTPAEAAVLRGDARVALVEPDRAVELAQIGPPAQEVPTGVRRVFADENPAMDVDGQDDVRVDVDVAVLDTGIAEHSDLDVVSRVDCTVASTCVEGGVDDNGHGTHVAGTIGAIDNGADVVGVAPGARLHAVKVCDASSQCLLSSILAGLDHVTVQAGTIEVANMSLAGPGTSAALDQALSGSVDAGVVHVVAAGNSRQDVAGWFPGNNADAIAVSAVADADGEPGGLAGDLPCRPGNRDEVLADFSNFGAAVDLAAPGVCIQSTWNDGGLRTMSGTSMASPHVAGAAAVLASGANDPAGRDAVLAIRQQLVDAGNLDWVDDSGDGVQEPLLDTRGLALAAPAGE